MDAPALPLFSCKGKTTAVTGGSRGIGFEVSRALAEVEADVAIIYHSSPDASATASLVAKTTGVRVQAYQPGVRSRSHISETMEQIGKDFGHLVIVVANAGVCANVAALNVAALDYDEDSWSHFNQIKYDGAMWTVQAAGRVFKGQGRGNLIITASLSSVLCNTPHMQAGYNASKAAVAHLTRCLAVEWEEFARVNCVGPAYVNTKSMCHLPPSERPWLC